MGDSLSFRPASSGLLWACALSLLALRLSAPAAASAQAADDALEADVEPDDSALPDPTPEDDRRARELFVLGDRLYEEGRYEGSVTAFAEAYRLSGRPLLLFNLANAEERLGRLDDAAEHLRAYLPHAPSDERAAVSTRIASIEERAEAARRAEQAQGHDHGETSDPPDHVVSPPEIGPNGDSSGRLRRAGVASLITGGALMGAGVVFGVLANRARDDARAECAQVDGSRICSSAARGALDRDARDSLLADIGVGVGVAVAVTGLVLWLRGRSGERPSAITPEAVVAPGRFEMRLHARF